MRARFATVEAVWRDKRQHPQAKPARDGEALRQAAAFVDDDT